MSDLEELARPNQERRVASLVAKSPLFPSGTGATPSRMAPRSHDPWPPLGDKLTITFWLSIGAMALAATSILMPWVRTPLGDVTGAVFFYGKIIGVLSIIGIFLLIGARKASRHFSLVAIVSGWGLCQLLWIGAVLFQFLMLSRGPNDVLASSSRIAPDVGLYIGMLATAGMLIGFSIVFLDGVAMG